MLGLLKEYVRVRYHQNQSKAHRIALQKKRLRDLLKLVWRHSAFYRRYYADFGIKETDLNEVELKDLPFVSKSLLMDHLDEVFTAPGLRRTEIEAWIAKNPEPKKLFNNRFQVMHTSGSSGNLGIFVYDANALNRLRATLMAKAVAPRFRLGRRAKIAFVGAIHGRFSGVIMTATAPSILYTTRLFSVMDPYENIVNRLNQFQPDILTGYAAALTHLAHLAEQEKLRIQPTQVVLGAEPLSREDWEQIHQAWHIKPIDLYSTTEAVLAASYDRDEDFRVFHDLSVVEAIDDELTTTNGETRQITTVTNLYNTITPIIRYQFNDHILPGQVLYDSSLDTIKQLFGRVLDALPITTNAGQRDNIHPVVLVEFFVPGMEKFQFLSEKDSLVTIRYVAETNLDTEITHAFKQLLALKHAEQGTSFSVRKVDAIPPNPRTGKIAVVDLKKAYEGSD